MGSPNAVTYAALALFAPLAYLLIRRLGARRGVQAALFAGWLFLPVHGGVVDVPFLHSKTAFVASVILLVSLVADSGRWRRLRWHAVDLLALAILVGPYATALDNGMSSYEGLSAALDAFSLWSAPYLLGRAYFGEPRALKDYATWLVGAALLYVLPCLWEVRMSPQLHRQLYGFSVGSFLQTVRFGGYRPQVFMSHGLMVGTFMATGTLVAYWLWRRRAVSAVAGVPIGWCLVVLAVTTVVVKSSAAIVLMLVGIAVLEGTRALRSPALLLVLALVPPAFCLARVSGWSARDVIHTVEGFNRDRAESLEFRVINENMLMERALQRPVLGWGRWGRSRVYDEDGKDIGVTDSIWIIALGTTGTVGLLSIWLLILMPILLLMRRHPARRWDHPRLAPAAVMAVAGLTWIVDGLLNAMVTPLFPAMAGATITFLSARWARPARAGRAPLAPAVLGRRLAAGLPGSPGRRGGAAIPGGAALGPVGLAPADGGRPGGR